VNLLLTSAAPSLAEGRVRLRDSLPEAGPAVLAATDEEGGACFVEVVADSPGLHAELHNLSRVRHPGLPVVLDTAVWEGRHLVALHPGPGQPLSKALEASGQPWSVTRVARALGHLCQGLQVLHRETEGRLPGRLTPADLWLTAQGGLRLRSLGLSLPVEATADKNLRMALVMQDLVRILGRLCPAAITGEFLWLAARCESADPSRCYRSFAELAEALERPLVDKTTRLVQARPQVQIPTGPPPRRSRAPALLAGLFTLGLMTALAWWWLQPAPRPVFESTLAVGAGPAVDFYSLMTGRRVSHLELEEPVGDLAATPDGSLVFATQPRSGRLALLDVRQGRVRGSLVLDSGPQVLTMSPDGSLLFVSHPSRSILTVVDLHPKRLMAGMLPAKAETILAVEGNSAEVAWSVPGQDGEPGTLFVASGTTVSALGLRPTNLRAQVRSPEAGALALSPAGQRLYVAHRTEPRIEVLDAGSLQPIETWPLLRPAVRLLRAGNSVYAVDARGRIQPVDDAASGFSLPLDSWKAVACGPRTDLLWALGGAPPSILVVRPSQGRFSGLIPAAGESDSLVFVQGGTRNPKPAPGR